MAMLFKVSEEGFMLNSNHPRSCTLIANFLLDEDFIDWDLVLENGYWRNNTGIFFMWYATANKFIRLFQCFRVGVYVQ
jgi:hypothetical protein